MRALLHGDYEDVEEEHDDHLHDDDLDDHAHEEGDSTLSLRVAAVFIILAAGLLGSLPPLYAKVGVCGCDAACSCLVSETSVRPGGG